MNNQLDLYIKRFDTFSIVKYSGMRKGFIFYLMGFLATSMLVFTMISLIICGFKKENRKSIVYIVLELFLQTIANQTKIEFIPTQLIVQQIGQQSQNVVDMKYTEQIFSFNNFQFNSKQYSHLLKNNMNKKKLFPQQQFCISIKDYENPLSQCNGDGILITNQEYFIMNYQQMQEHQFCEKNCAQFCSDHNFKLISGNMCQLKLYLQNVCFVYDNNNILNGCYQNGEYRKWSLTLQPIEFLMVHKTDPYLLLSQNKISANQSLNIKYSILGGFLLLIGCGIMIYLNEIKKKQYQQETLEQQLEFIQNNNTRNNKNNATLIPLNY